MPKINISFDDKLKRTSDYCTVTVTNNKGIEMDNFKMTLDEVFLSIADNTFFDNEKERLFRSSSPILPRNCISYGQTISVKNNKRVDHFLIEVPKQQWDIYVYNTMFMEVGFPRMLFSYSVEQDTKQITNISVYAIKEDSLISDKTILYKFPFSNVGDNGGLCLGSNQKPILSTYDELTDIHKRFFFSTPFTSDYFKSTRINAETEITSIRELAAKLASKPFPDDWLARTNKTVNDLIINN